MWKLITWDRLSNEVQENHYNKKKKAYLFIDVLPFFSKSLIDCISVLNTSFNDPIAL